MRLHDLRHNVGTVGAGLGQSLETLARLLGHSQTVTTERYANLADDPVRAAVEQIGEEIAGAMGEAPVVQASLES